MKCEICGCGPADGTSIYRSTPKGEAPHWRCEHHLAAPAPADVVELVAEIEAANAKNNGKLQ